MKCISHHILVSMFTDCITRQCTLFVLNICVHKCAVVRVEVLFRHSPPLDCHVNLSGIMLNYVDFYQ